ncbi:GNAT family N-acetyltransferase [Lacrimispora sp. BS-2]|uniref:GNAT family N-acetyltransferase n=1 Tax=Lacrimispora sp. BS-2 TaxID=3151850 RepID=A0AAU7PRJ2_9FIRM
MIGNKIIGQHEYNIRLLTGKDESEVQDFCERCSDFFELTEGRPPEKDAGNSILFDLPPGKTPKDKYDFGVYNKNGVLIAVIDIVKDYKAAGEWIIGLLMLDPNVRESGLGRRLHDFIKDWVLEEHGRALRIGVVEENHRGYKFWCKMGYIEVNRVKMTYGNKEQTVKVMILFLK